MEYSYKIHYKNGDEYSDCSSGDFESLEEVEEHWKEVMDYSDVDYISFWID